VHVPLVLVLDESVPLWLSAICVLHQVDALDGAERLELSPQLGLARVVVNSRHEQRLEGVLRGRLARVWVPERNFLLQLVRHLLLLLLLLAIKSENEGKSDIFSAFVPNAFLFLPLPSHWSKEQHSLASAFQKTKAFIINGQATKCTIN
jgi:hypothetical protein